MTLWRSPIGQCHGIANFSGAWQRHFDGNRCCNAQFGLADVAVVIRIGRNQHRRCASGRGIHCRCHRIGGQRIACLVVSNGRETMTSVYQRGSGKAPTTQTVQHRIS